MTLALALKIGRKKRNVFGKVGISGISLPHNDNGESPFAEGIAVDCLDHLLLMQFTRPFPPEAFRCGKTPLKTGSSAIDVVETPENES